MIKKIFIIAAVCSILFLGFINLVFAQGRKLEVDYPAIGTYEPEEVTTEIPKYVKYIYSFIIWVSGFIALGVLINAGFQWFTSAGSPEKINEAKDRISAALLGLLILFGSYLILITINPDLTSFHLERLRPIMPSLSAGVLLCKEFPATDSGNDAVLEAWELEMEYKLRNPTIEREKEIKKMLDRALDKISLKCYSVEGEGDIRTDFDNETRYAYFIPNLEVKTIEEEDPVTGRVVKKKQYNITEYGAILYEERNFEGKSQILAHNLTDPQGSADAYGEPVLLKASSIKPFALIYEPNPGWQVVLYQEYNKNTGVGELTPIYANITTNPDCQTSRNNGENSEWWCDFALPWPPKSMEIEGDLLVMLCKDKVQVGSCEVFFSETENNLEEYDNIVNWEICRDYENGQCETKTNLQGTSVTICRCARAAATWTRVISAKPY